MGNKSLAKIYFRLKQDKEGYPPNPWESLWAKSRSDGLYTIDNIPFFIKGIGPGDVVRAKREGDMDVFAGLVVASSSSVFRVYVHDEAKVQNARASFRRLGVQSELSHVPNLFSIDIPGNAKIDRVLNLLNKGKKSGDWDFEEGVLRHELR